MSSAPVSTPASAGEVGEYRVSVYLYDLSQGMAKALSHSFLGKQIDGIWHTGIVVYGHEYFFGGGIQATRPGMSMAGQPTQVIPMGYTRIPPSVFHEWLRGVSHRFTAATYSLLEHNCNNFTDACSKFLLDQPIPSFITGLPSEALSTPFGQMLRPMIAQMEQQMRQGGGQGMGAGMVPWGNEQLMLPTDNIAPDRMVSDSASTTIAPPPTDPTPAQMLQGAAALTAALGAVSMSNAATAASTSSAPTSSPPSTTAAVSPVSPTSSSSSSSLISLLNGPPATFLTSFDRKSKSFQILLKTSAKKVPSMSTGLTSDQDAKLTRLVNSLSADDSASSKVSEDEVALVDEFLLSWPASLQFPVLGLLRLLILRPECQSHYGGSKGEEIGQRLIQLLADSPTTPVSVYTMALCTLSNLLTSTSPSSSSPSSSIGRHFAESSSLWDSIRHQSTSSNMTIRLMAATLAFNACLYFSKMNADEHDIVVEGLTFMIERVKEEDSIEVINRLLLAIGQIMIHHRALIVLMIGLEFGEALDRLGANGTFQSDGQFSLTTKEMRGMMVEELEGTARGQ